MSERAQDRFSKTKFIVPYLYINIYIYIYHWDCREKKNIFFILVSPLWSYKYQANINYGQLKDDILSVDPKTINVLRVGEQEKPFNDQCVKLLNGQP